MTISPKASMIYSVIVAVLAFTASGVMPSYIPAGLGKEIAETAAFLLGLSASINAGLHGLSAPQAGPLVATADKMTGGH